MLIFVVVVLAAVALILVVGRNNTATSEPAMGVTEIGTHGLVVAGDPAFLVAWDDVWEITVLTRRAITGTWFGFEIRADGAGLLSIDGPDGLGERFLAEAHRFPGFDHVGLGDALTTRRPRFVCFTR